MKLTNDDSRAWWLADRFDLDPGEAMMSHITRLKAGQTSRYDNFKRLCAAYEFGPRNANRDLKDDNPLRDKVLQFNHARGGIDTVHAKFNKERTLPMALTCGGGYLQRKNASELEKALHGELRKVNETNAGIDEVFESVSLDGLVCGIGFAQVLHGRDSLIFEHAPADDMLVDQAETRYKRPRSLYRRFLIDRYVLLDHYGVKSPDFWGDTQKRISKIRKCRAGDAAYGTYDDLGNMIEVWAGWHLAAPNGNLNDGVYEVAIDGCCLEFLEWDRPRFPFAWFVPYPRTRQLHGLSLMQDFLPVQEEHDKFTDRFQRAAHAIGGTHLLVAREANVNVRELNNGQGTAVDYDAAAGVDPVKPFHPELFSEQAMNYRNNLFPEALAAKGIPTMSATGGIPDELAGASGKALEVAEEKGDEKLLIPFRAKERFIIKLSWLIIDEIRAIVERDPKYTVRSRGERRAFQNVEWSKALMDADSFDLDLFPVDALSKSPSAKFAQLTELLERKAITVEQFRRLYALPDLEAENDVDLSDLEVIDRTMDEIVIEGRPLLPESFDYLKLIITRGRKFYNMCRNKEVPEERLQLLRDYIEEATRKDAEQTAAAAPQNQANAGAPQPASTEAGLVPPTPAPPPAAGQ